MHPATPARRRKAAGVGPAPQALRGYQQRAVTLAATGRNMIVVGDTGSGKTVIAVARAVDMTLADPSARTVFLAPTVQLVQQQTGERAACWVVWVQMVESGGRRAAVVGACGLLCAWLSAPNPSMRL